MTTQYAFPTKIAPIQVKLKFHYLLKVLPCISQRKFVLISVTISSEVFTACMTHWVLVYHALSFILMYDNSSKNSNSS